MEDFRGGFIRNTFQIIREFQRQACQKSHSQGLQLATASLLHPSNDFTLQLKSLLQSHPNVDVAAMGFPVGWENDPLWK